MTRMRWLLPMLFLFLLGGHPSRTEGMAASANLLSLDSRDNGKHVTVAVGQAIEITVHTVGPQEYGAPKISSSAVRFESVAFVMPLNPGGSTQVLRFQAVAEGEASIQFISVNPENVFAVTVTVGHATARASLPLPDQENTATWTSAWTNLLNDARQSFIPSMPRLTNVEVGLILANPGPSEDTVTLSVLNSSSNALGQVSKIVQSDDCAHVVFSFPHGGLTLSPGQVYSIRISGSDLFGWKYTEDGYKKGAASFNGKPLLPGSNFLFRTYGKD